MGGALDMKLSSERVGDLGVLEAAGKDGDEKPPKVFCVKDRKKVQPTDAGKCPDCGTDLSKAIKQAKAAA